MLKIIELTLLVLILFGGITQIAFPLLTDRPLFPLFRSKAAKLRDKLVLTNDRADTDEVLAEIKRRDDEHARRVAERRKQNRPY